MGLFSDIYVWALRVATFALSQTFAVACENTTSISVPERAPVLIWNRARLASTSALVSDRLTPAPSEA